MTALLVGLLICVGVAVAVIVVVALPHLREGEPLLTPEGERLAEDARRTAIRAAGAASSKAGAFKDKLSASVTGEIKVPRPAAVPPRQVASAAATPAPGTPVVNEPAAPAPLDRTPAENPRR